FRRTPTRPTSSPPSTWSGPRCTATRRPSCAPCSTRWARSTTRASAERRNIRPSLVHPSLVHPRGPPPVSTVVTDPPVPDVIDREFFADPGAAIAWLHENAPVHYYDPRP